MPRPKGLHLQRKHLMTRSTDEDPISPEDLAKLLTEPMSKEDLELVEYGSELLGLQHLPKPGFSFECVGSACEFDQAPLLNPTPSASPTPWTKIKADYPPTMEDMERWEALVRDHLEQVLSIFLTPKEVEQAIHDVGTEGFDCVLGYLRQVAQDAGHLPFGPYGDLREPQRT